MKKGIHPENYRLVAFKDMSNDTVFITRSCATTKETLMVDGVEYPVVKVEISNTSHPFYTGKVVSTNSIRDTRADRNNFCRIKYKTQSDESGWVLLYILLLFGKAQELVDSDLFEFCCYYPCLWSKISFRINRFSRTK